MLAYKPLKNNAGVMLTGDYLTLKSLHSVLHEINEGCPIIKDKEGVFVALAYDVRKALEGQRTKIKPPKGYPEIGPIFGVEILWPVLLLQTRMMRVYMGFMATTKLQQAHAYAIEALVESAIEEIFPTEANDLIERWNRINPAHPWAEEKINSRGAIFSSWGKVERRKGLSGLLSSLDPMYPLLYEMAIRNGNIDIVAPEELDTWDGIEWADPRW